MFNQSNEMQVFFNEIVSVNVYAHIAQAIQSGFRQVLRLYLYTTNANLGYRFGNKVIHSQGLSFRIDKNFDLSSIMEVLLENKMSIRAMNTLEPSLEDAFIAITGNRPAVPGRRFRH